MLFTAGTSIAYSLWVLRASGICKLHKTTGPILKVVHETYRWSILFFTFFYILLECIYAYMVRDNMDLLAQVMFLLLCHFTSLAKQLVFFTRADAIEMMIDNFEDPLYNQKYTEAQNLLKQTTKRANRLLKMYMGTAILTCTLWITFPAVEHYQKKHVDFFFWIGNIDSDKPIVFELILGYTYIGTTLVGIVNTTMDTFISTTLSQMKTQIQILRYNLEILPDKLSRHKQISNNCFEHVLRSEFVRNLEHYKKIIKTASDLEDIFSVPILIQFTMGGWILCMAAYKIVDEHGICLFICLVVSRTTKTMNGNDQYKVLSLEFASMLLFILCILVELLLYCFFGNEAAFESGLLTNSIYVMNWLDTPVWFQKYLIIVMERVKKPLRPAAGGIVPLTLEAYITILKSSYTFYAVLRQTK